MTGPGLRIKRRWAALIVILGAGSAQPCSAQALPFAVAPSHRETASPSQTLIATGPWSKTTGLPALTLTGAVTTQSWHLPDEGRSTLQLLASLQDKAQGEGFDPVFTCADVQCGGFDFRFAIPVVPEPDMHVDLGNFRYAALTRATPQGPEYQVFLVSRGPGTLYVQITTITPGAPAPDATASATDQTGPALASGTDGKAVASLPVAQTESAAAPGTVVAQLQAKGGAALDDLVFAPAAAALVAGDYASLTELGAWLLDNPSVTLAFVGHSDATGGLTGNVALSRRRAESVRAWVQDRFDLPPGQTTAEGVGYLSPRASNATPEGQAANRRVEVMITSTP